jgi:hypothetical protein
MGAPGCNGGDARLRLSVTGARKFQCKSGFFVGQNAAAIGMTMCVPTYAS